MSLKARPYEAKNDWLLGPAFVPCLQPPGGTLTAVDLSLSIIILFLLGGLTVKALIHAHDKGELLILRRPPRAR